MNVGYKLAKSSVEGIPRHLIQSICVTFRQTARNALKYIQDIILIHKHWTTCKVPSHFSLTELQDTSDESEEGEPDAREIQDTTLSNSHIAIEGSYVGDNDELNFEYDEDLVPNDDQESSAAADCFSEADADEESDAEDEQSEGESMEEFLSFENRRACGYDIADEISDYGEEEEAEVHLAQVPRPQHRKHKNVREGSKYSVFKSFSPLKRRHSEIDEEEDA